MEQLKRNNSSPIQLGFFVAILVGFWTISVVALLVWNLIRYKSEIQEMALQHAIDVFEKDLVYRRWAIGHGGVYVPVTEQTPPNPYLSQTKDRDIKTPSGLELTLINPAYMTRQVHEMGEKYGIKGHITSLKPLNPINTPDEWERKALLELEDGATTVSSVEEMDGEDYLRLMRPLLTEEGCLKCHGQQGYKVGDIRGGMGVSIPMAPLKAFANKRLISAAIGHGFLWLLGLGGIAVGSRRLNTRIQDHARDRQTLQEVNQQLRMSIEQMPTAYILWDTDLCVIEWNPAAEHIFGYDREEAIGKKLPDLIVPKHIRHVVDEVMIKLKNNESVNYPKKDNNIRKDGTVISCQWHNQPLTDKDGAVFAILSIAEDVTEKLADQERLLQSENRFRRATLQSPFPIMIHAEDGEILQINEVWTELTGYTSEDIPTLSAWTQLAYGERKDIVKSRIDRLFDCDTKVKEGEYVIMAKDGKALIWDFSSASLGKLPDGRRLVISTASDITSRKQAEEELHQYACIVASSSDMMAILDTKFVYLATNDAYLAAFDKTKDQVVGHTISEVFGEDIFETTIRSNAERCLAGNKVQYENWFQFPAHGLRYMSATYSPYIGQDGNIKGFVVSGRDITERKFVEQKAVSLAKFPSENPEPVVRIAGDGTVLYANEAAETMLVEWGTEVGQAADDFWHKHVSQALQSGLAKRIEREYCGKIFSFALAPVVDAGYANIYGRDITERRRAEQKSRQHQAELAHAARVITVGEMATGIAHEINQPLCAIVNYADACLRMARSGKADSEKFTEAAEQIASQAERAGKILHRVKNMVEKQPPQFTETCINDIIAETLDFVASETKKLGVKVAFYPIEEVPAVYADPILIQQVIINMVRNSLEAMAQSNSDSRNLTIRALVSKDGTVEVAVSDTGSGISSECNGKVFDSFFTTKPDGLGIGLSISKSIIESHGGRLWVTPNADRGVTFHFTLPVRSEDNES